jgi:hypothetical protein
MCRSTAAKSARATLAVLSLTRWPEALGAPVAASSAPVGHAGLGGGWQLDVGKLRTRPFALPDWHGLLGMTVTRLMPSFPGHSSGEWRNNYAFAALCADGSVVTWGNSSYGGIFGSLPMSLGNALSLANPDTNEVYSPTGVNHYYGSAGNDWLAGDVTDETLSGGAVGARYLAGVPNDSGSGGLRHGRWRAVRGTIRGSAWRRRSEAWRCALLAAQACESLTR